MSTNLEDAHNSRKVTIDENKKLFLSDVIKSIEFRISKHREFIKKHEQVIVDNVNFANIITDEINNINERKAKIEELKELIEYSL
tara:strand:+ start:686 stop:940 length:255 start_codon:yes stop_codon:yes gene_type:complete